MVFEYNRRFYKYNNAVVVILIATNSDDHSVESYIPTTQLLPLVSFDDITDFIAELKNTGCNPQRIQRLELWSKEHGSIIDEYGLVDLSVIDTAKDMFKNSLEFTKLLKFVKKLYQKPVIKRKRNEPDNQLSIDCIDNVDFGDWGEYYVYILRSAKTSNMVICVNLTNFLQFTKTKRAGTPYISMNKFMSMIPQKYRGAGQKLFLAFRKFSRDNQKFITDREDCGNVNPIMINLDTILGCEDILNKFDSNPFETALEIVKERLKSQNKQSSMPSRKRHVTIKLSKKLTIEEKAITELKDELRPVITKQLVDFWQPKIMEKLKEKLLPQVREELRNAEIKRIKLEKEERLKKLYQVSMQQEVDIFKGFSL